MEGEVSLLLDNIARATIDVFHSYTGSGTTFYRIIITSKKMGVYPKGGKY